MIIKCPLCSGECESEVEPEVGRHVQCPHCSKTFAYGINKSTPTRIELPADVSAVARRVMCSAADAGKKAYESIKNADWEKHRAQAQAVLEHGKSAAKAGYAKGNKLIDNVSFLKSKRNKLIVWSVLAALLIMLTVSIFSSQGIDDLDGLKLTSLGTQGGFQYAFLRYDGKHKPSVSPYLHIWISKTRQLIVFSIEPSILKDAFDGDWHQAISTMVKGKHKLFDHNIHGDVANVKIRKEDARKIRNGEWTFSIDGGSQGKTSILVYRMGGSDAAAEKIMRDVVRTVGLWEINKCDLQTAAMKCLAWYDEQLRYNNVEELHFEKGLYGTWHLSLISSEGRTTQTIDLDPDGDLIYPKSMPAGFARKLIEARIKIYEANER